MNPKMAPSKRLGQPCGLGDQYQGHFPARHPPPLFLGEITDICFSAWIGRDALPPEDFTSPIATQSGKFCPKTGSVSPRFNGELERHENELSRFLLLLTQLGCFQKDECGKIRRPKWRKQHSSALGDSGNQEVFPSRSGLRHFVLG